MWSRAPDGVRRRASDAARALLARLEPGRTVMMSQYPVRPAARWGWGSPAHPELADLFAERVNDYADVVARMCANLHRYRDIAHRADPPAPCWDNPWWGGIDAAVHIDALIERRPGRYVEVGSGRSTMFARHTIDEYDLGTKIISIDPQPRREIDALCDEVIRRPFEDVAHLAIDRIQPGDVVLIDGSHMTMMGGDTVVALLEFLPRLPPGVLVAVDDIFLPFDYHPTWGDRWYGEQYVLAGFLLGGGRGYEVRFPTFYVSQHPELTTALDPLWPLIECRFGHMGSTMWLERPES